MYYFSFKIISQLIILTFIPNIMFLFKLIYLVYLLNVCISFVFLVIIFFINYIISIYSILGAIEANLFYYICSLQYLFLNKVLIITLQ